MYSFHLLRVYRDGLYSSCMLYVIACIFGIFLNYKENIKKIIPYMIGFGIFATLMAITREETIWIAPFTIGSSFITSLFIVFDKECKEKLKKILLYLIPISIYLVIILIICIINKSKYGEFIRIEENSKAYRDFIKAISSVDVEEPNIRVPVSKEARQKLYEVSPSFAKLKDYLDNNEINNWEEYGVVEGEIEDGWIMWAIFDALDNIGLTDNAKIMNDYFRQTTKEINDAFEDGRLKKEDNPASLLDEKTLDELVKSFKEAFEFQVKLKELKIKIDVDRVYVYNEKPELPEEREWEFREITGNISTNSLTYNYKVDKIKIKILNIIKSIYENLSKPLFFIGIIIYLLFIIRFFFIKPRFENYKELIILTSLLMLYLIRLVVIAYTNTAKFPSIDVIYLSSTYSMQFTFEILSLVFGVAEILTGIKNLRKKIKGGKGYYEV